MENGIFETHGFQLEKAKKALKLAKEIESQKRAQGARYERTDQKTWRLTSPPSEGNPQGGVGGKSTAL